MDDEYDEFMNMLLGSGAENMEEAMMRMFLGMGGGAANSSSGMCNEDDWENHSMGELFRAVRRHDTVEVETLLEQESYREGVDELDGDGAGVLHNLALDSELYEEDAEAIVQAFKNAGADLDLRGGSMMYGNTPLHVAACYGNIAMAKALIDAGATADICDNFGKTPLNKADDVKSDSVAGEMTFNLIQDAVTKERSDPNYVDAVTLKANEIRLQAEEDWKNDDLDLAMENYQRLLQLPGCDEDYRNHANLAGCALQHAIEKAVSGVVGGRNSFKIAYKAASKAVELEPTFEIGWEEVARAYMGYRELPRAKQACKNGLKLFPESEKLKEIWSVLDQVGVPDEVVDHESQEFKDIYDRIYMERWVGPVGCDYCALNCMEEPRPDKCPFCGCPDKELDEDAQQMIICLTMYGKKDDSSINGEEDDDMKNNDDNSNDEDDDSSASLFYGDNSIRDDDDCEDVEMLAGAGGMEEIMMRMFLGMGMGGANSSSGMCNEDDWENHPMGELFRAARLHDTVEVETLLEQDSYREGVDELDGDGAGVLHNLALDSTVYEKDAEAIVQAFKNAGADLDLRGGSMMSGETPLHVAACYGNIAMAKALIDAGATADICDNFGKTPLHQADGVKSVVGEMTFKLIQDAVTKERSDPKYAAAVTQKANEMRLQAEEYWKEGEMDVALEMYQRLLQLPGCDEDYRNHANLAGCALGDAIIKKTSGIIGGRNSFKIAYKAASKAVELEPTFEISWNELARAYMGYRELPRAKQACKNGLKLFPESEKLKEIWSVLDQAGVPDTVVDHESQEFKDIYERIYMKRWIGPVGCDYCELKCMEEPRPDKCPFCGCPDKELDDETDNMIICLTLYGKKDDSSINGEEYDALKNNEDNSFEEDGDSENLEMPPLVEPCASNTNPFTFAAPSQSGSTSFDFGSPSNGTETKFVFGSPETKGDSK